MSDFGQLHSLCGSLMGLTLIDPLFLSDRILTVLSTALPGFFGMHCLPLPPSAQLRPKPRRDHEYLTQDFNEQTLDTPQKLLGEDDHDVHHFAKAMVLW
jgi:hypothetical protein